MQMINISYLHNIYNCCLQHGQQEAVAWLVENTRDRERLASNNGERCLLHAAARYGQVSHTQ